MFYQKLFISGNWSTKQIATIIPEISPGDILKVRVDVVSVFTLDADVKSLTLEAG